MVVGWPGRLWAIAPEEGLAKSMPVRIWKGNKATIAWYRHVSGAECYECVERSGAELITVIKKRQHRRRNLRFDSRSDAERLLHTSCRVIETGLKPRNEPPGSHRAFAD